MPDHGPAATWENLFFPPAGYTYFRRPFEEAPASGSLRAAWMGDAAVLAFRGTETDDLTDTLTDLRFLMCKGSRRDPLSGNHQALVHSGFADALNQVWQDACRLISDFRKLHPGAPLFFTGHSLGAALATLSFTRAALAGTCLYTLGCPRVGNAAYCTVFAGRYCYFLWKQA